MTTYYSPDEIAEIIEALNNEKGCFGMSYNNLLLTVALDENLCNTIIHALDNDANEAIKRTLH